MMKKILLVIIFIFLSTTSFSLQGPNEESIYFHIHQAMRWAKLHYSKNTLSAAREMRDHLQKIWSSEKSLSKSIFYKEYKYLEAIALNMKNSSFVEIESFRANIHQKAEKLKVKHPDNWQEEFLIVQ